MDYLQYQEIGFSWKLLERSFKPYYKWITFNTCLNLIKTGRSIVSFKPYYKWITFNTNIQRLHRKRNYCCFKPYYKWITFNTPID